MSIYQSSFNNSFLNIYSLSTLNFLSFLHIFHVNKILSHLKKILIIFPYFYSYSLFYSLIPSNLLPCLSYLYPISTPFYCILLLIFLSVYLSSKKYIICFYSPKEYHNPIYLSYNIIVLFFLNYSTINLFNFFNSALNLIYFWRRVFGMVIICFGVD